MSHWHQGVTTQGMETDKVNNIIDINNIPILLKLYDDTFHFIDLKLNQFVSVCLLSPIL
jgi:hypothetical protein